jgi:hypothetical protein
MKNILILVSCMLLCVGVLCASTNSLPANLMAQPTIASDGAFSITSQQLQAAGPGQGAPMPICPPSNPNCMPWTQPQLGLQAAGPGQGAPMPICPPSNPNCMPWTQPQLGLQAAGPGQGAPMPICYPGAPCGIQQERLPMVL